MKRSELEKQRELLLKRLEKQEKRAESLAKRSIIKNEDLPRYQEKLKAWKVRAKEVSTLEELEEICFEMDQAGGVGRNYISYQRSTFFSQENF